MKIELIELPNGSKVLRQGDKQLVFDAKDWDEFIEAQMRMRSTDYLVPTYGAKQ